MARASTDETMKKLKVLGRVLRHTGADKIIAGFIGFLLLCSLVIWLCEPEIHTWRETQWYCFTMVSTIGFGDVVVHTAISRILSVAGQAGTPAGAVERGTDAAFGANHAVSTVVELLSLFRVPWPV